MIDPKINIRSKSAFPLKSTIMRVSLLRTLPCKPVLTSFAAEQMAVRNRIGTRQKTI